MQSKFDAGVREISSFTVIAFLWSWLWWSPRVLSTFSVIQVSPALDAVLGTIGAMGPGIAAFLQIWRRRGKTAAKQFGNHGWKMNFHPALWIPALLLIPAIGGITTAILLLAKLENPWDFSLLTSINLPFVLILALVFISAIGEEIGWRGYAQPLLQGFLNPLRVSLVLGLIWGVWQLPLHFVNDTLQSALPVLHIILQAIALSVLFTWLYNKSGGSLPVAILFHFSISMTGLIFPVWAGFIGQWSYLLLIIAGIVGLGMVVGLINYRRLKP
jgi:hypothetical protein